MKAHKGGRLEYQGKITAETHPFGPRLVPIAHVHNASDAGVKISIGRDLLWQKEWQQGSSGVLIASSKRILAVGIPASPSNAVNPISIAVVTSIIATFGEIVVAGFGVATRIGSLFIIPMLALSAAIWPFTGQNWGPTSAKECLKLSG